MGSRHWLLHLMATGLSWIAPNGIEAGMQDAVARYVAGFPVGEASKVIGGAQRRVEMWRAGEFVEFNGRQRDPRMAYKSDTVLRLLGRFIPDEVRPDLRTLVPQEVKDARQAARMLARYDDHYVGSARQSNAGKREQALALKSSGASIRDNATELGVGKSTVSRWLAGGA